MEVFSVGQGRIFNLGGARFSELFKDDRKLNNKNS